MEGKRESPIENPMKTLDSTEDSLFRAVIPCLTVSRQLIKYAY